MDKRAIEIMKNLMCSQLGHLSNKRVMVRTRQAGVVLFFALIALVAMSLAAVALIRSVDTNSLIAGNLSFKQSTMFSSDRGVEVAMSWVVNHITALEANDSANGYYATNAGNPKALVDASGKVDGTDAQGNTISYVVQRMCSELGPPSASKCLLGEGSDPNSKEQDACKDGSCPLSTAVVYRITARVEGAKNTLSYVQAFVY